MRFLIRNEIPIRKKLLGTCAIGIDLLALRVHAATNFFDFLSHMYLGPSNLIQFQQGLEFF